MKRFPIAVLPIRTGLVISANLAAQDSGPNFILGFEVPEGITGAAGEIRTFEAYVTLTTLDNPSPEGVQGWLVAVQVEGGVFREISLAGLEVSTIFDHDGDPSTPPVEPYLQDLEEAGFAVAAVTQGQVGERGTCAVASVVLHQAQRMVLEPNGTQRIARLTVEAAIPVGPDCAPLSLEFSPCPRGGPPGPWDSKVTFLDATWYPRTDPAQVVLCRTPFRRGDFNGDGQEDISDPIAELGYLYLDAPAPACRSAADANDDGQLDITDPVIMLLDLFSPEVTSSLPPPGPFACGVGERGDPLGCESYPACR